MGHKLADSTVRPTLICSLCLLYICMLACDLSTEAYLLWSFCLPYGLRMQMFGFGATIGSDAANSLWHHL